MSISRGSPIKKHDDTIVDKMEEIRKKLIEIRDQRELVSPKPYSPKQFAKQPQKETNHNKKGKKLHHSNLDCVMFEVANSPYLIHPKKAYPENTVHLKEKYESMKSGAKKDDIEIAMAKKKFEAEITNYKIDWQFPKPKDYKPNRSSGGSTIFSNRNHLEESSEATIIVPSPKKETKSESGSKDGNDDELREYNTEEFTESKNEIIVDNNKIDNNNNNNNNNNNDDDEDNDNIPDDSGEKVESNNDNEDINNINKEINPNEIVEDEEGIIQVQSTINSIKENENTTFVSHSQPNPLRPTTDPSHTRTSMDSNNNKIRNSKSQQSKNKPKPKSLKDIELQGIPARNRKEIQAVTNSRKKEQSPPRVSTLQKPTAASISSKISSKVIKEEVKHHHHPPPLPVPVPLPVGNKRLPPVNNKPLPLISKAISNRNNNNSSNNNNNNNMEKKIIIPVRSKSVDVKSVPKTTNNKTNSITNDKSSNNIPPSISTIETETVSNSEASKEEEYDSKELTSSNEQYKEQLNSSSMLVSSSNGKRVVYEEPLEKVVDGAAVVADDVVVDDGDVISLPPPSTTTTTTTSTIPLDEISSSGHYDCDDFSTSHNINNNSSSNNNNNTLKDDNNNYVAVVPPNYDLIEGNIEEKTAQNESKPPIKSSASNGLIITTRNINTNNNLSEGNAQNIQNEKSDITPNNQEEKNDDNDNDNDNEYFDDYEVDDSKPKTPISFKNKINDIKEETKINNNNIKNDPCGDGSSDEELYDDAFDD
eukprot:gene973-1891_t